MAQMEQVVRRLDGEQDDVLASISLVKGEQELERHLFDQLSDLMVEQLFADLRSAVADGRLSDTGYARELRELVDRCQAVGLLPSLGRRI